jgi:hemolysin D
MTAAAVVALILAAVTWTCLSSVDAIVTAPGKLITTSPNLVVQPLETSVIREVHVKVGDTINRGDVLATLDPTFSQADVAQLRTKFSALDAAINRLNAELNGRDFTAADLIHRLEKVPGRAAGLAAACPAIPGPPGLKHLCRVAGCGSGGAIEVRTPKT